MNHKITDDNLNPKGKGTNDPIHLEWALILLMELLTDLNELSEKKQIEAIKFEFDQYGKSDIKDSFTKWLENSNKKNISKDKLLSIISIIKYELEGESNAN